MRASHDVCVCPQYTTTRVAVEFLVDEEENCNNYTTRTHIEECIINKKTDVV